MATEDLLESGCSKHGLDRHVCVHEAGHAVAAIDNRIAFRAVVSHADGQVPVLRGGISHAAASIELGRDPRAAVKPDPVAGFLFAMAGVAAEHAVLGDSIEGGYDEDFRFWRVGTGTTAADAHPALESILGQSVINAWSECLAWAEENLSRIETLAAALGALEKPWEMTQQQVTEVLAGPMCARSTGCSDTAGVRPS